MTAGTNDADHGLTPRDGLARARSSVKYREAMRNDEEKFRERTSVYLYDTPTEQHVNINDSTARARTRGERLDDADDRVPARHRPACLA